MSAVGVRWACAVAWLGLARAASGQAYVQFWGAGFQTVASDAATLGDLDGDGIAEFAGAYFDYGTNPVGGVGVFSGATSQFLFGVQNPYTTGFGASVDAVGDIDLDGAVDFIAGAKYFSGAATGNGAAYVYSGSNGALLRTHYGTSAYEAFGTEVTGVGDLDADGRPDYCVTATGNGQSWRVDAFSGASGALLFSAPGFHNWDEFGYALSDAGDVDQDGHDDLVVGAPAAQGGGRVAVLSGANGSVSFTLSVPGAQRFGHAVAGGFEVDGDGTVDLAVASPTTYANSGPEGHVRVFSGATQQVLAAFGPPPGALEFGASLARIGDLDGDGRDDLALRYRDGANPANHFVAVHSSATGTALDVQKPLAAPRRLGTLADFDLDGRRDFFVAVADSGSPYVWSAVQIHLGGRPSPQRYCTATPYGPGSCVPKLQFQGGTSLTIGPAMAVSAAELPPDVDGWFVWSLAAASLPFGNGTLCVSRSNGFRRMGMQSTSSFPYYCGHSLHRTLDRAYLLAQGMGPGITLYGQWVTKMQGTNRFGMSDAVAITWAP